jgi:glycosyltransferase involved in cell wall biosynthesis
MRVLLYCADQNPHRDRSLGITEYTRSLVLGLAKQQDIAITCLVSRSSFRPENVTCESLPFRTDTFVGRLAADHLHQLLVRTGADLCHYPKGYLPFIRTRAVPHVGTVHDLIFEHYASRYPTVHGKAAVAYWRRILRRSIGGLDLLLTVTETSRRAIEDYCDRFQIRCPRIVVTYTGSGWEDEPPSRGPKGDYVLHLASRYPHKRTAQLLDLWSELGRRRGSLPRLELIGPRDDSALVQAAAHAGVQWHPLLPRSALKEKIACARALIIPSEIEGFSLPALEAHYLGTPVVFVRGTAIQEVVGEESPGAFDIDDHSSFEKALDQTLALSAEVLARRAAILREKYSIRRCAERTADAYCLVA